MLSIYPACFYKEDNGYSVIFPDLNYLATQGETLDKAIEMAIECLAGYLYSCNKDCEAIPAPSNITEINPVNISNEICPNEPIGEAFVNLISVDVEAYAKKHFEKSVRKTLTIPAWLNSAALEQGINFSQTLQEALICKLKAQ